MAVKVLKTARSVRKWREGLKNKKLGFVPTMGNLHEGHLSLIKKALKENDRVVVSIFVNPAQFSPSEDYKVYPRTFKEDLKKLEELKVHAVFVPKSKKEVYPNGSFFQLKPPEHLDSILEAKIRPHFFTGVCSVVLRLFNLVDPHRAYFGEKDYQQLVIIKRMVEDLHLPIKIRSGKTMRKKTGLALSSRNSYLEDTDMHDAAKLYRILNSNTDIEKAKGELQRAGFGVEYLESWKPDLSEPTNSPPCRWLAAVQFRGLRLIDNVKKIKN